MIKPEHLATPLNNDHNSAMVSLIAVQFAKNCCIELCTN